ncbi:MAG TPA: hypothetical protein VLT91_03750 [Rhizomicrobium sp.]|nr:hypothetical protein [Rhizomicrobium sp.]
MDAKLRQDGRDVRGKAGLIVHAFVTIAAMTAIFAAHVLMMFELRPRGGVKDRIAETKFGEDL